MSASSSAVIIIDDRATNVSRAGQWANAGVAQEFLQTTTSSGTAGSTLIFTFEGTGVEVRGTIGFGDSTSQSFSLDGTTPEVFTSQGNLAAPQFHQQFFSATSLSDGEHKLLITQESTLSPTTATNLFVDYFLVTPSSTAELSGETLFYDDTNAAIIYSSGWSSAVGTDQDLQTTLHGATLSGATATINFNGNTISVFGNIHNTTTGSIASFALDGGTQFTALVPSPAPGFDIGVASNQQLYSASQLTPGNHTLVMTASAANSFFLDYITVTGFQNTNPSSNSSSTTTSSTTPSSTPSNGTAGSPSGTPNPSSGSGSGSSGSNNLNAATSHSSAGAIAGGVVGAVIALVILTGVIVFFVRRRNRQNIAGVPNTALQPQFRDLPPSEFNQSGQVATQGSHAGHSQSGYPGSVYLGRANPNGSSSMQSSSINPVSPSNTTYTGTSALTNPWASTNNQTASRSGVSQTASSAPYGTSDGRRPSQSITGSVDPYGGYVSGPDSAAAAAAGAVGVGRGMSVASGTSGGSARPSAAAIAEMKRRLEWANPTPVVIHQDSGIRNLPTAPQPIDEVPPSYTQE